MKYLNETKMIIVILVVSLILSGSICHDICGQKTIKETKPWTYWWWMGSAVDSSNITYNLEEFSQAGIGGVHIIPIYGVKGYEEKFIDYLSPRWMEMLAYTGKECDRLGIGMDMTLGTGWPFGGPNVPDKYASDQIKSFSCEITGSKRVEIDVIEEVKKLADEKTINRNREIISVDAFGIDGKRIPLINNTDKDGLLNWTAPKGEWKIIALVMESPVQLVKRAAPGGKGNVVDPFSKEALNNYLGYFDKAFENYSGKMPGAFYHDSYEYYNADWTRNLLNEFKSRRGYDLLDMLPEFLSEDENEITARVKSDYRCTVAELHTEFIETNSEWANNKKALFRNQAHGSPTNLLDTYAAADIPECEVFGAPKVDIPGLERDSLFTRVEYVDPLILKFASSAAHVSGKNLVSSETGTWLSEHFRESLSQIKPEVDLLMYSGVNHIFYHGMAYSPKDEEWPGWQFYAATNYAPTNSIWYDIPSLNKYIERCQSVLQSGKPDNEILVYFPVWDIWHSSKTGLIPLQVHQPENWLFGTPFYKTVKKLYENGYSFDYASDNQIKSMTVDDNSIISNSNKYKTIVIPSCRFIPVETYKKLLSIIETGGKVVFVNGLPDDVPGFNDFEKLRIEIKKIRNHIMSEDNLMAGKVIVGSDILFMLSHSGIPAEEYSDYKIDFIRRKTEDARYSFLVSHHSTPLNNWVKLAYPAQSVFIFDPMNDKTGKAKTRLNSDSTTSVYLQIDPGASLILKAYDKEIEGDNWEYFTEADTCYGIKGEWNVEFIQGGPVLPLEETVTKLESWTNFSDNETKRFAGTARYKLKFHNPDPNIKNWILDLGKVCESARVKINNVNLGTIWSFPFKLRLGDVLNSGENILEIEVTNLSANRIRDLDLRGVDWKKFYDINFVNIFYKKFDASGWELKDSGLLGPVMLYPAENINYDLKN